MNTKDYISSGVLESYAMGELSDKEMQKVECMALVHDEIKAELDRIELAYEHLAMNTTIAAKASLKDAIWNDIQLQSEEETPVKQMPPVEEPSKGFSWLNAASIIAILGLGALAWFGHQENQELVQTIDQQQTEQAQLNNRLAEIEAETEGLSSDLAIVNSERFVPIRLKGTDNAPKASVQVYWDAEASDVYLAVQEMSELEQGKVYQLWALDGGVPVDAGTFTPTGDSTLIKMKSISSGQTFAVTIENEGGSPTPALETLQVIGNVPESV